MRVKAHSEQILNGVRHCALMPAPVGLDFYFLSLSLHAYSTPLPIHPSSLPSSPPLAVQH